MRSPRFWSSIFHAGVFIAGVGLLVQSIELMAFAMFVAGAGYALRDYLSRRVQSITPMTVYALFVSVWWGLSNLIACYVIGTMYERSFYAYSDYDYLLEAQVLSTLMGIVPLLLYGPASRLVKENSTVRWFVPDVGFDVSDKTLLRCSVALVAFSVIEKFVEIPIDALWVARPFLHVGALIVIFVLAWHWYGPNPTLPRWTWWMLLGLVAAESSFALLFSYMRGEIIYPVFVLLLAVLLRKAVTRRTVAAAILILVPFAYVYSAIGTLRGHGVYGGERLRAMVPMERAGAASDAPVLEETDLTSSVVRLFARACNFGQLSQVVRVSREDGFYQGETLTYLAYVFIPRMIWPDKPLITPGQWFAERIGRGTRLSADRFSNSINMTLAGELYLNFGWSGAVAGLVLLSFLFALFWESTAIFKSPNNIIGLALAVILLRQATVTTAAVTLPQLVISYATMLLLTWAITYWTLRRQRRADRRDRAFPGVRPGLPSLRGGEPWQGPRVP